MTKVIDKVGLALVEEGRLLLARSRGDAVFQIPGGKVEAGDADDLAALVRECREELGVEVDRASAEFLGLFAGPAAGKPGVVVEVKLYRAGLSGRPSPCAEIEELLWHPLGEDLEAATETVRRKILPWLRDRAG